MEKSRKPKIRFKGFTADWEQCKLGELSSSFEYGLNAASKSYDGINKYIRITDIDDETRTFLDTDLTSPDCDLSLSENYLLKDGDILFARTGASVGKTFIYKAFNGVVYYAGFLIRARLKENCSPQFVFYNTLTKEYEKFIRVTSQRSGQPGVNAHEYATFELLLPKYDEQCEIGKFFTNLDYLITLHQRKLDKLINVKKSMLEKMFPKQGSTVPEIRFNGFTQAWEQRKLGDCILELKSGLSRMLSEEDIGMPVVRANNIENDKLDMSNNVKYWYVDDPQGADTLNYTISKNDVLINFINSENKMGTAAIVEKTLNRPTIYTTNILKMKLNDKCYNYYFLAYTHTKDYKEYIKGISKIAVNQASFTTVDFKNYNIKVPSIKEQSAVGEYFRKIDELITLHQRKLEKLKNIKKSMLEKMFI